MDIKLKPIGTIHTPYNDKVPHQPEPDAKGEFYIELNPDLSQGLYRLEPGDYIYVMFYMDRLKKPVSLRVTPPWAKGLEVGLFASRSPCRPNPIGLTIVTLKGIAGNRLTISGIDALDGTPLIDIKPYVRRLDLKEDARERSYVEKDH